MNRNETIKMFAQIASLFPRDTAFARADAVMVEAWCEMLSDIAPALAAAAVKAHAATSPYAPAISDIRDRALRIAHPETRMTGEELWSLTLRGVSHYGRNRKQEALATVPEYARDFVSRWFIAVCDSEQIGVESGQFLKAWEAHSAKRHDDGVMLAGVTDMIGSLTQHMTLGARAEINENFEGDEP